MKKRILVLANSIKHQGNCLAGKDIETKEWIRVVGDSSGRELHNINISPLSIVDMELEPAPLKHQPDNYVLKSWNIVGEADISQLPPYLDSPNDLWGIGNSVFYQYIQDELVSISQSLYIVPVKNIQLYWKDRSDIGKDPQRRGRFIYNSTLYDLPITDPKFEHMREETLFNKYLTISLGEPYNGSCYKILASIL